ncbi:unnamed protein product [Ilex paraguariensis]|uniref:C3H1-type domain-containing protein n=1 Tax=Ilex paraguariensis TaxID=185542 RepID=A0ABC8UHE4_9AQUA
MGTYEGNNNNNGSSWVEPQPGFTATGSGVTEEALIQKFENVGLNSSENLNESINNELTDRGILDISTFHYPLRPYAEDCPHYLRTGRCKFGPACKFNHPVKTTIQVGKGKKKDTDKEGFSGKMGHIECKMVQVIATGWNSRFSSETCWSSLILITMASIISCKLYYLTAGGCKYGNSCRFMHSKAEPGALLGLNFLGLPIRSGKKECSFYMRNGTCGYGVRCMFHHPDPTSEGGTDVRNSTLSYESVGQYGHSLGNCSAEFAPLHVSGASAASQPAQASWDLHTISNTTVHYLANHSSYMPSVHSHPQEVYQNLEWSGYQAPNYAQERAKHPRSAPGTDFFGKKADAASQAEEFPERPGLPECNNFMKTGDCKFKSACVYHHPKSRAPKANADIFGKKADVASQAEEFPKSQAPKVNACHLSDKGLPIRPGTRICKHYERFGICKYGRACSFNHPVNHEPFTSAAGPILESPGSSVGSAGDSGMDG